MTRGVKNKQFLMVGLTALSVVLLISCKGGESKRDTVEQRASKTDTLYEKTPHFPVLIPQSEETLLDWKHFKTFEEDMNRLGKSGLSALRDDLTRMAPVSDTLLIQIPDTLNTNLVTSRLRVVIARVKLLEELAHQYNPDAGLLTDYIEEAHTAFAHLLLQINETFERAEMEVGSWERAAESPAPDVQRETPLQPPRRARSGLTRDLPLMKADDSVRAER